MGYRILQTMKSKCLKSRANWYIINIIFVLLADCFCCQSDNRQRLGKTGDKAVIENGYAENSMMRGEDALNKLEANISLLAITFFSSIQYVFLANIPQSVSAFAFLAVTNLIGFLIALAFWARELYRITKKQVLHSFLLAGELFGFNVFLFWGSKGMDASVVSSTTMMYLVFVPIIMLIMRKHISRQSVIAVVVVMLGVFLTLGADPSKFANKNIIYLMLAAIMFALYIVTVDELCTKASPAILAMGQMMFGFVLAFLVWYCQARLKGQSLALPADSSFWSSVIFISLFIRGIYGVVQISAQRYVSTMNTSLIFSTEIVMTLVASPLLSRLLGTETTVITPFKLVGAVLIVVGVLTAEGTFAKLSKGWRKHEI